MLGLLVTRKIRLKKKKNKIISTNLLSGLETCIAQSHQISDKQHHYWNSNKHL